MGRLTSDGSIQPLSTPVDYKNNRSYVCWNDLNGNGYISQHNHATGVFIRFLLKTGITVDNHNSPSVLVMANNKILTVYAPVHNGAALFRRISTNADDISAWGSELDITPGTVHAYPFLLDLPGESDKIYLFWRDGLAPGLRCFSTSTDFGVTFSAPTTLFTTALQRPYFNAVRNGTSRIDFVLTDAHPTEFTRNNIYHFYYLGGSYFKSDGTALGSPPFTGTDVTLVYDGTTNFAGQNVQITIGADGKPQILFVKAITPATNLRYMHARWTGSAWSINEICAAGSELIATDSYNPGGMCFDHSNPTHVFVSVEPSAGLRQLEEWITGDNGATWAKLQTIEAPTTLKPHCVFPHSPQRANNSAIRCVYFQGTFPTGSTWITALNSIPQGGYPRATIIDNLVSLWPLDEVSGTRYDAIGGNNLTDINTVTQATGKIGNAASFASASTERLETPTGNVTLSPGDKYFYVSAWVYLATKPAVAMRILGKGPNGSLNRREFNLVWDNTLDRFYVQVSNNGTAVTNLIANTFGAPALTTFYFVEFWHDPVLNFLFISINGITDSVAYSLGLNKSTDMFVIGSFPNTVTGTNNWNGRIDNVLMLRDYIPTPSERAYLYNSGLGRSLSQLTSNTFGNLANLVGISNIAA